MVDPLFEKIYSDEEKHLFSLQENIRLDDSEPDGPEPFPSEWRKIITDDYIKLLNKAVASEISAIIQYTNQHEKASLLALRQKNTPMEAIIDTNKAKVVSHRAYGFRSAKNYILNLYHCMADLPMPFLLHSFV